MLGVPVPSGPEPVALDSPPSGYTGKRRLEEKHASRAEGHVEWPFASRCDMSDARSGQLLFCFSWWLVTAGDAFLSTPCINRGQKHSAQTYIA